MQEMQFVCLTLLCVTNMLCARRLKTCNHVWNFHAEASAYFFSDDFILLPVFRADRDHLHLGKPGTV